MPLWVAYQERGGNMKVVLANVTPNPIEAIYKAYKICYSSNSPTNIKAPSEDKMIEFIKPKMGHTTPLEQAEVTFYIEGVSRALTHQLVRHRTANINQQSQRYVELGQFEYVIPPEIAKDEIAKDFFLKIMEADWLAYELITNRLQTRYMYDGVKATEANKKAIEDARYVLPNACTSNIIFKIDLHNFRNFYRQRNCKHAQWEIQGLAREMMRLVKEVIPFANYKVMNCGVTCWDCLEEVEQ
jgi:thymidylate synthase (FAD)